MSGLETGLNWDDVPLPDEPYDPSEQRNGHRVVQRLVLATPLDTGDHPIWGSRQPIDAAAWLFDEEDTTVSLWGNDDQVLWAEGEALMIAGGQEMPLHGSVLAQPGRHCRVDGEEVVGRVEERIVAEVALTLQTEPQIEVVADGGTAAREMFDDAVDRHARCAPAVGVHRDDKVRADRFAKDLFAAGDALLQPNHLVAH